MVPSLALKQRIGLEVKEPRVFTLSTSTTSTSEGSFSPSLSAVKDKGPLIPGLVPPTLVNLGTPRAPENLLAEDLEKLALLSNDLANDLALSHSDSSASNSKTSSSSNSSVASVSTADLFYLFEEINALISPPIADGDLYIHTLSASLQNFCGHLLKTRQTNEQYAISYLEKFIDLYFKVLEDDSVNLQFARIQSEFGRNLCQLMAGMKLLPPNRKTCYPEMIRILSGFLGDNHKDVLVKLNVVEVLLSFAYTEPRTFRRLLLGEPWLLAPFEQLLQVQVYGDRFAYLFGELLCKFMDYSDISSIIFTWISVTSQNLLAKMLLDVLAGFINPQDFSFKQPQWTLREISMSIELLLDILPATRYQFMANLTENEQNILIAILVDMLKYKNQFISGELKYKICRCLADLLAHKDFRKLVLNFKEDLTKRLNNVLCGEVNSRELNELMHSLLYDISYTSGWQFFFYVFYKECLVKIWETFCRALTVIFFRQV